LSHHIKISAIILTKNSERRLRECIESLIEIVDEIIVIDGYSTDGTVSICNDYPKIRVFQKSFEGFAKERTYALGKVKGDWVIQIDSDEVIKEKCASELRRMILSDCYDAIKVWNKTFFAGKFLQSSDRTPAFKAFKIDYLYYNESQLVHEIPMVKSGARVGVANGLIIHYHDFDLKKTWRKFARYAALRFGMEKCLSARRILTRPIAIFFVRLIRDLRIIDGFHGLFLASIEATACLFVGLKEFTKILNNARFKY